MIHQRRKVGHFKVYYSAVRGKSPYYPLHEAVKDTTHNSFGWGDSKKIWMENSRIACNSFWHQSCVDVVDSVEVKEQKDVWQQGKQYQWLAPQMILSVEEDITQLIIWRKKRGRKKRQWPTIYIQSTANRTTVNRTSNSIARATLGELLPEQH